MSRILEGVSFWVIILLFVAALAGPFFFAHVFTKSHGKRLAVSDCPRCGNIVGPVTADAAMREPAGVEGQLPLALQRWPLVCDRCGAELEYLVSKKKLIVRRS